MYMQRLAFLVKSLLIRSHRCMGMHRLLRNQLRILLRSTLGNETTRRNTSNTGIVHLS